MRRRALAAVILAAFAPRAAAIDISPGDEYTAAWSFLGAASGSAFGAALGGLTRASTASRVKPYLRWGAVGSLFGGTLGHEVAADAVAGARADESVAPRANRETGALLGAIGGELAGFGLGAALAGHVGRERREIWAGVALGALLGAAGGLLLPTPAFLAPPRGRPAGRTSPEGPAARVEPARGMDREAAAFARDAGGGGVAASPARPAGLPARVAALNDALLRPEDERMIRDRSLPALRHEPAPMILPALAPDRRLVVLARSVLTLGLLEGAALGAAAGGSVGGDAGGQLTRMAIGMGVGALAGWSATAALARPWTDEGGGWSDPGEGVELGRRTGAVLVGGVLGTLVGGAAGATIRNADRAFSRSDVALSALAGNLTGLLASSLLTSPRRVRD